MLAVRRLRTVLAIVALLLGGALGLATAGVSAAKSITVVAVSDGEISGEGPDSYRSGADGASNFTVGRGVGSYSSPRPTHKAPASSAATATYPTAP